MAAEVRIASGAKDRLTKCTRHSEGCCLHRISRILELTLVLGVPVQSQFLGLQNIKGYDWVLGLQ